VKILTLVAKPFTALAGRVDHAVERKILMSVLRHVATAIGTALVAKGIIDAAAVPDLTNALMELFGVLLALAGIVSGAAQKRHS
jgi:hypothetical protein